MGQSITNINEFTDYWREKLPSIYKDKTDEYIIGDVRQRYPQFGIPSYDEALQTHIGSYNPNKIPISPPEKNYQDTQNLNNVKTDPDSISSWFLTADFIPESFAEKGFMGISPEFFQSQYINSMAGQTYKYLNGKEKYKTDPNTGLPEGYDPSYFAQGAQMLFSLAKPLDLSVMAATGFVGKGAQALSRTTLFGSSTANAYIKNGIFGSLLAKTPKIGVFAKQAVENAVNLGIGGSGFVAAHALTRDVANQRMSETQLNENGEEIGVGKVNINNALKVASDEFLHSLPLFALTGGITNGIMGPLYGYANAFMKKGTAARNAAIIASHPVTRVGEEALLFTSLPSVFGHEGAPSIFKNPAEFWGHAISNATMIGGMRLFGGFAESPKVEAFKFIKSAIEVDSKLNKGTKAHIENVKNDLLKSTKEIPKDLSDLSTDLYIKEKNLEVSLSQAKKDIEFIQEINQKLRDPEYRKKAQVLGSRQNKEVAKHAELSNIYSLGTTGIIADLLVENNTAKLKEVYKEYYGEYPNDSQLTQFKASLKSIHDIQIEAREAVNEYVNGGIYGSDGTTGAESKINAIEPVVRERTIIGGKTREQAIASKTWTPEYIAEKAKELGVAFEYTKANKIKNRKEVIEDIFNQQKSKDKKAEKLAEIEGEKIADTIAGKITGRRTYPEIENIVLKEKLLKKDIKGTKELSGISDVNKNILTYILDRLPKNRYHTRAAKEANKLAKYIQKKYKRNLHELTADELVNLGRDYIQERVGADVYDLTHIKLQEKYSDKQIKDFYRKANYIRDSLNESFKFGQLDKIVGDNIVAKIGKIPTRTGEKITIQGGKEGFDKWIDYVKTKADDVIEFIAEKRGKVKTKKYPEGRILKGGEAKTISKEGAELAIKTALLGEVRPTEMTLLKVKHVNPNTGEIRIFRSKQKGATQKVSVYVDKSLARKLIKYAKKNNKGADDRIFPFESAKEFNAFTKWLSDNSGTKVELRIDGVPSPMGKGREYGRVFRALFKGDSETKESAARRGTSEIATKQYETEGTPVIKNKKQAERLPEEVIFKTKGDKAARDKFIEKVMKKNNMTEESLKRIGLEKGVLGEFSEGIIKLQKGLWQPADFYHENMHRLKQFAEASNNKSLMKLIQRGEKLAVNTKEYRSWKRKNKGRDVEEFLSDIAGGKASRIEFSKGFVTKVGNFVKQLVSRIKVAFGKGNFNDIARVLAKRIQRGFSTEGVQFAKGQIKYKIMPDTMTQDSAYKYTKSMVRELFKENKLPESKQKDIIRWIGEIAELGENFKLTNKTEVPEMRQFVATINSMDKRMINMAITKHEKFELYKNSENLRLVKNITEAERKQILKNLNVKDGEIFSASSEQMKDFINILNTMDDVKQNESWIDRQISEGIVNQDVAAKFTKLSKMKYGMPVIDVIEGLGLTTLADKLNSHVPAMLGHIGKFKVFEGNMRNAFGRPKWSKIRDMMYLFDKERYMERKDNGWLKPAEKEFINNALDTKTWTPKNTKEGMLVKEHKKLMKYYKDQLVGDKGILREILNEAEFEKFMNDKNINWISEKNNVYVQRRLTREFKEHYRPSEKHFEKLVDDQTDAVSFRLAKRWFKERKIENPTKEKLANKAIELREDARSIAHSELYELFDFNPGKYSPSFLKERHVKLPEFLTIDGKRVKVYETRFDPTTKDYAINQAQFLANIEFFPEFVKIKGFNITGEKRLITELRGKNKHLGDWVDRHLKNHLKINRESTDYPGGIRFTRKLTSSLAKLRLSFPTSGLKNFLIGSTQSMLAWRTKYFWGGLFDSIHKDNRAFVRGTGATEIGMKHFDVSGIFGKMDKVLDKGFFRAGLMKPSENLNRYVSVLASKRQQVHLADRLASMPETSRSYQNAVRTLKTLYKLSDAEIQLFKKVGMKGTKALSAKEAGINKRAIDNLYQKMNTYAHINTQGAAIDIFMPDWASKPLAQSALLYKRMAYAASVNTYKNGKLALKNGSPFRLIAFGLGTMVSGEVLLQFYDKVLGTPMPDKNSSFWKYLQTLLWKGEFLGLASEFFNTNLYEGNFFEGLGNSIYPSVLSTVALTGNTLLSWAQGEKYTSQTIEDLMTGATGLFNGINKLREKGLVSKDSYAYLTAKLNNEYKNMMKEIEDADEIVEENSTEITFSQSPSNRAFRDLFNSGYDEDLFGNSLGKWYMMTMFIRANNYHYKGITESGIITRGNNPEESATNSMKEAVKQHQTMLTNMNKSKMLITAKDKKGKKTQLKKALRFKEYLDRNSMHLPPKERPSYLLVPKLQDLYAERIELLEKSIVEYLKENNLEKDLNSFGIKIHKDFKFLPEFFKIK